MLSFKSILQIAALLSASATLAHESPVEKRLPSTTWYQPRHHPVHNLFRRASLLDVTFAEVGSDDWKKGFPTGAPDAGAMPKVWSERLDAAVKDGKIPSIPQTTQKDGGDPTYPDGTDPSSPEVCSSTYKCRTPDSIWDGPAGYFGISFDDGPLPFSDSLLDYLKRKNQKATHFMIGQNVLENPNQFKKAFEQGHDIALHTYTHRAMTTLSNNDVVAELGWNIQIIHNSTGGFVPKFWRPPYGDSDTRVQAIAREVFGLKTVIWNKDTNDWGIAEGSQKKKTVETTFNKFLKSSKKTGLVVLEHESSKQAVDIFISGYPSIARNGWKAKSLVQLIGDKKPYQNVNGNEVTPDDRFLNHNDPAPTPEPEPTPEQPEEPEEPEENTPEEPADEDDGDEDTAEPEVMPTKTSSSDEAETTEDSSDSDDSSSSDDSDSSDSDTSSGDEDSSSSDDEGSSSSDEDGTSTASASDEEPSEVEDSKTKGKDNGAAALLPRLAGLVSGSLLILLCMAPGAMLVLG